MENNRWRFFHDGNWRWHRLSPTGRILDEAKKGYPTLEACVLDASENGYPNAPRYARAANYAEAREREARGFSDRPAAE